MRSAVRVSRGLDHRPIEGRHRAADIAGGRDWLGRGGQVADRPSLRGGAGLLPIQRRGEVQAVIRGGGAGEDGGRRERRRREDEDRAHGASPVRSRNAIAGHMRPRICAVRHAYFALQHTAEDAVFCDYRIAPAGNNVPKINGRHAFQTNEINFTS